MLFCVFTGVETYTNTITHQPTEIEFINREEKRKLGSGKDIEIWREEGKRRNIEIYNKSFLTSDTRVRKRDRERERIGRGYNIIPT